MPALGITGGVATGKSSFAAALGRHLPIVLFDADQCAHDLLARDSAVRAAVEVLFGREIYDQSGAPDRARLREIVFSNSLKRRELEQLLHPAIRARWVEQAREEAARDGWFCADIPLLYETEAQSQFEAVIVVACSPVTQRARLLENRGLSAAMAKTMIAAQFDLRRKMAQADYLIWNDSTKQPSTDRLGFSQQPFANASIMTETATPLPDPPPTATEELAPAAVPAQLWIDVLHGEALAQLLGRAAALHLRLNPEKTRHHIVFDLLKVYAIRGTELLVDGILEMSPQGSGFLRWPRYNFRSLPQDVYVPAPVERHFGLRNGHRLTARIRAPRDREKFMTVENVLTIEGIPADSWKVTPEFDRLTALHPTERIILENSNIKSVTPRAVDLIAPLGRGQRGLIVAPPRTGKTVLLKDIALSILANSPETHLILLLVDERPEEVTDFKRSVDCEIYSSTFDEGPARHTGVAEIVSDRAKRLVELGKHVVILLDSITRLSRGYNNLQGNKGRTMSGGVDSKALVKPKKFFGAARNTEEGGSLTILATALVDTNSRMDDLIFEEYKGTGNMELHLDRGLADKRVFPAINVLASATRRDELLYHPQEFERVNILRRQLAALPPMEATETLIKALQSTKSNAELLLSGVRD